MSLTTKNIIILGIAIFLVGTFVSAQFTSYSPFMLRSYSLTGGTSTNTAAVLISPTWYLGVGTTSPYAKLSVVGEVVGQYFTGTSTTTTSTIAGGLKITGGGLTSSTLTGCDTIDTDSSGNLTCGSDATGAGGSFPFTPTTWGGVLANSTTTLIQFLAGTVSATSSIGTLTSGVITATS